MICRRHALAVLPIGILSAIAHPQMGVGDDEELDRLLDVLREDTYARSVLVVGDGGAAQQARTDLRPHGERRENAQGGHCEMQVSLLSPPHGV